MKDNDWVLLVFCRGCGIYGTAHVREDHTLGWPDIVHEADCDLAEPRDRREWHAWMAGAPAHAEQAGAGQVGAHAHSHAQRTPDRFDGVG
jgi:hypothetical protein